MQISNGIDVNALWTNSIAISKSGDLWSNINVNNITVRPQKTTDRNMNPKFRISLLDGLDEVEYFFLNDVTNQPTWTNDIAGISQAILDITSWISSSSINIDAVLNDILNEVVSINSNTEIISNEVDLKSKSKKWECVGTDIYIGYASPGSSTSDPVWAIKKVIETGTSGDFLWADSNKNFDNVWDNRLSLSYG